MCDSFTFSMILQTFDFVEIGTDRHKQHYYDVEKIGKILRCHTSIVYHGASLLIII